MRAAHSATLRGQLLRWLLIPLSLLFVIDAIGSYFIAARLSDRVYDGELLEIARELNLHVRPGGSRPARAPSRRLTDSRTSPRSWPWAPRRSASAARCGRPRASRS